MFNNIYYINQAEAGDGEGKFNSIIDAMKVKDGFAFAENKYEVRIGGAVAGEYLSYVITGKELETIMYGDADGNEKILTTDAILILQHVADTSVSVEAGADADGNEKILTTDAILVLQHVADNSVVLGPQK